MTSATRLVANPPLLDRVIATWGPISVWLFGSRARGEGHPGSDWDILAVVPDELADEEVAPVACWRLGRGAGVVADLIGCHASDFADATNTPNTLAYEIAREGVLLYER